MKPGKVIARLKTLFQNARGEPEELPLGTYVVEVTGVQEKDGKLFIDMDLCPNLRREDEE